jgi:Polyketide cyclase / dehydrase and lipid transport
MGSLQVSVRRRIGAPALVTYAIIADYRDGHPLIVPPGVFKNLIVEEGGIGEGTTIRFDMSVLGRVRHIRARIAEPSPGRVLTEEDVESGILTTFHVAVADGGRACSVTITTDLPRPTGPFAGFQARIATWFLQRVFTEELERLDTEARRRASSAAVAV